MNAKANIFACIFFLCLLILIDCGSGEDTTRAVAAISSSIDTIHPTDDDVDHHSSAALNSSHTPAVSSNNRVPKECALVMAKSSIPNAGWGVFSLIWRNKNDPIQRHGGDVVIQIPDLNPLHAQGMRRLLWEYLWDGQETGGQYEGAPQRVSSMVPGLGMLANGEGRSGYNILPSLQPNIDSASLRQSPGSGAVTYYHNFTWYAHRDIAPGDELLVNYGVRWFQERGLPLSPKARRKPSVQELRLQGYCLDNLRPGQSDIPHAGRGCFAARTLSRGQVVVPVPVIPVRGESLSMIKQHESGSDMVNLINHSPAGKRVSGGESANVRMKWPESSWQYFDQPIDILQNLV